MEEYKNLANNLAQFVKIIAIDTSEIVSVDHNGLPNKKLEIGSFVYDQNGIIGFVQDVQEYSYQIVTFDPVNIDIFGNNAIVLSWDLGTEQIRKMLFEVFTKNPSCMKYWETVINNNDTGIIKDYSDDIDDDNDDNNEF